MFVRNRFASLLVLLPALGQAEIDFNRDVRPILSENCFHCHGPDSAERQEDLRLDTEEGALSVLKRGDAAGSLLIERIHETEDPMPPKKDIRTLTAEQKKTLTDWVNEGAPWAEHWSFVSPTRPELPETTATENAHPIDRFIHTRLGKEGLKPSPEASPEKLIRRASLDLTGIPPTLVEIDAFKEEYARDPTSAFPLLIDRLLASPRYGEHMALPWLDAARYADTDGYQFDGPRSMWRWRDWVIDAYNAHMPFDQFTIEQLAGDLIPDATVEQRMATGFNRNHRYNSEEGIVVEEFLLENAVDRVDTTATLWMGLTMGCARCHDHKYDPVSIEDYYGMIAFFNSIPEAGRAIKQGNSEPIMPAPNKEQQAHWAKLEAELAEARAALDPPKIAAALEHFRPTDDLPIPTRGEHVYHQLEGVPKGQEAHYPDRVETHLGLGYRFDGEQYAKLDTLGENFPFRATSKFSVSLWIRPQEVDTGVIVARQDGSQQRKGFALDLVDGHLRFDLIARWISSSGRATTVEKIQPGRWTHIAITNDGSSSAHHQKIYIDGIEAKTTITYNTNSNPGGVGKAEPLRLGKANWGDPYRGEIDELNVFAYTLWREEINFLAEPATSSEIGELAPAERSQRQQAKLRTAYLNSSKEKATAERYSRWVNKRQELEKFVAALPDLMVMEELPTPKKTFVRERGVYDAYGKEVTRAVPAALPPMSEDLPRNRLGFAKWLVSGEHPLTARVAVNRYWQHFFGTGIVKTAEDFGIQAEAPSHPELLDWLATEFVESGWDVQHIQKLIMTSATYRQDSRIDSTGREVDPENRLLARGPRLRLSGQAIRDTALHASGLLVEKQGGPSVSPYQPKDLWIEMSMGRKYQQSKGDDLYRRSLYTIWKRTVAPPTMAVFDAADREACAVNTSRTNTPLQALALLNETAFVEAARNLAARLIHEEDPVSTGFRIATSRSPTEEEQNLLGEALHEYLEEFQNDPDSANKLLATGDSPTPDADPIRLAALTALANVLLNLDEAITKE